MDQIISWFADYGYGILFFGLLLEFLFLPFPGGTVMGFSGVLAHQGELMFGICILFSGLGSSMGMVLTYFIGAKLGKPFFEKHGSRFFMGPKRRQVVQNWFQRFGNKIVFISFFVPGIRHFTGYFMGIVQMKAKTFILYTIGGAFSWATLFVSLGYFLGPKWEQIISVYKMYTIPITIGIMVLFILVIYLRKSGYGLKSK